MVSAQWMLGRNLFMSAAKNTVRIQRMCVAALLCAIAILIPMISPVKIQLGPMSFTLGSHVAIFIAMFISPAVALTVELGATLGFLLAKKPAVMKNGLSIFLFGLVMGVIHGVLEAVVVTAFWFSGMTMEGTFVSTVLGLVGVGTVVHSMVDYYLALLIWQPVSRAAKLPASFTFSKS